MPPTRPGLHRGLPTAASEENHMVVGGGGWAEVAKERDQEKEEQRQVEEPPTLSSCLSRLPARPALLNCWDQKRSDG